MSKLLVGLGRTSIRNIAKLERNSDRDREDLLGLARAGYIDANVLKTRYFEEVRPYLLSKIE